MNNFARKQLEKHGWKEGKGLGLNEDGITKPLKASMKFDTQGLGHNKFDILTSNWWSEGFNKIASQIKVIKTETGVHVQKINNEITSKEPSPLKNSMKGFVKAGMLNEKKNEEASSSNMLIESTPKSLDTTDSHLNYEQVRKRKKSKRMKDSSALEPEILYKKEIKKKKHAEIATENEVFSATNANILTLDISKSHNRSSQKIRHSETEQIDINTKKRKKRKKNKNKRIT